MVGRNHCGNVITIRTRYILTEEDLRYIEKAILENLNQIVTVFWKNEGKDDGNFHADLDFDAKFPYDRYPLQNLIQEKKK